MDDYKEFPPAKSFTRVIKNCPKSAYLYMQLWQKRGKHMFLTLDKPQVRKDFLISPTLFRNLLVPLMFLNLIRFQENDDRFQIEIHGPYANE